MSEHTLYDGWVSVCETDHAYEAELVRDRLDDAGLEAVLLGRSNVAIPLSSGEEPQFVVLVPPHIAEEVLAFLDELPSEAELDEAAAAAEPMEFPDEETEA